MWWCSFQPEPLANKRVETAIDRRHSLPKTNSVHFFIDSHIIRLNSVIPLPQTPTHISRAIPDPVICSTAHLK